MNILMTKRGEMYCADFCDLTGSPDIGLGSSPELAIESLKNKHPYQKGVDDDHKVRYYGCSK